MNHRSLLLLSAIALCTQAVFAGEDQALTVIIEGYKFIPEEVTIQQGQAIRWENQEKRQYHSVWFETLDEEEPEDYLFPEDVYEREFNQIGSFPYRCGPHPEMTGIVRVTE